MCLLGPGRATRGEPSALSVPVGKARRTTHTSQQTPVKAKHNTKALFPRAQPGRSFFHGT